MVHLTDECHMFHNVLCRQVLNVRERKIMIGAARSCGCDWRPIFVARTFTNVLFQFILVSVFKCFVCSYVYHEYSSERTVVLPLDLVNISASELKKKILCLASFNCL